MKRLLKALERAGLVEMDNGAQAPEPAADAPPPPAAPPRKSPTARHASAQTAPVESTPSGEAAPAAAADFEQRPFADIYSEHKVAESPFPAERLLRVLDGLNALEPAARKTAVLALDSADDSWTVDDSLLDAERKIKVLQTWRAGVEEQTRVHLAEAKAMSEERAQRHQESVQRIRQQMADLEGLLEREVARATQDDADIRAAARAAREACARETARIEGEIASLERIATIFLPVAAAPAPHDSN